MEFEYDGKTLKFDKELSGLDKLVLDFIKILNTCKIKYVIVSGYVAILFGRARTTEDIDLFIERVNLQQLKKLFDEFTKRNFWTIDAESLDDAFDRLEQGLAIRIAIKDNVIPNFEIKFPKKTTDFLSLNKPLEVIVNQNKLLISSIEVQIPFKFWLGSDKDIEDALHLYELFKDKLDKGLLMNVGKELKIKNEMIKYGIL